MRTWSVVYGCRAILLSILLLPWACGEDCRPASLSAIDEVHGCVLASAEVDGLSFCHPSGQARTKGIRPICIESPDGGRFAGSIATDEHISGSGFIESNDCPFFPPPTGDGATCSP